MNRSHLAALAFIFALVLSSAAPVSAGICASPCKVLILPDLVKVPLPFDGWMVGPGTPLANITVVESPRYGSFDLATQVFSPEPDFWNFGLDRLIVNVQGLGPRVLLLVSATPLRNITAQENFDGGAVGTWTIAGAATYSFSSTASGYALRVQGAPGQTSTYIPPNGNTGRPTVAVGLGSGVNPGAPPAPFGDQGEEIVVQSIAGLLDVVMKTEAGAHYVRVKAVHPGFGCGGTVVCQSPYQQIPANTWTRISATIGPPTDGGPPNAKNTVRFDVTPAGSSTSHFEFGNLNPVSLDGALTVSFGMAGANLANYSVEIDDAEVFSLQQSTEDEHIVARSERFEAPGVGYENTWVQDGMLGFKTQGGSQWMEGDLRKLSPASFANRSGLIDNLPDSRRRLRLTFQLDVSGLNLADNDNLVIFASTGVAFPVTNRVVEVLVRKASGSYSIRARAFNGAGAVAATAWLGLDDHVLTTGPLNFLSLEWSAGSGSNGFLRLKLNHQYSEVNGISNSFPISNPEGRTFNSISFGPCLVNVATPDPDLGDRVVRMDHLGTIY